MNVKTMKKTLIPLLVLAMAAMTSCDLAAPADTGSFVDVTMDGASMGARGIGGAVRTGHTGFLTLSRPLPSLLEALHEWI
jgi:hypothetical protein